MKVGKEEKDIKLWKHGMFGDPKTFPTKYAVLQSLSVKGSVLSTPEGEENNQIIYKRLSVAITRLHRLGNKRFACRSTGLSMAKSGIRVWRIK